MWYSVAGRDALGLCWQHTAQMLTLSRFILHPYSSAAWWSNDKQHRTVKLLARDSPTLCLPPNPHRTPLLYLSFSLAHLLGWFFCVCGQEVETWLCDISVEVYCTAHLQRHTKKLKTLTNEQHWLKEKWIMFAYRWWVWCIFILSGM